jgi:hypothetical protein
MRQYNCLGTEKQDFFNTLLVVENPRFPLFLPNMCPNVMCQKRGYDR